MTVDTNGKSSVGAGDGPQEESDDDPTDHNPERYQGTVTVDTPSVEAMLDAFEPPDPPDREEEPGAEEKVRAWIRRRGFPLDAFDIGEHPTYGSIQFQTDGSLSDGEFDRYLTVVQTTDGVGYDGDGTNYAKPEWVDSLDAEGRGPEEQP